ncbi:ComF family protein [Solibacillus sp. MA9]|uniref:ComF family protein n=1 Tax=Solibacillus palustris TaxID=2908203 RepID=A0ABS9U8I6_9BACL|nr:phosphoribosyltransferase family protein [Solibacillus sp. MA9]MCH7320641.1 ComF family protein [Solibacillus sp. MA9]
MNKPITHCLLCERELQGNVGWQELLKKSLPKTICHRCEQRFEKVEQQTDPNITALFHYNDAMKDYVHRYKFLHDVVLAHVFNTALHEHLKSERRLIIPIPMHEESLKIRTFAQVDELLKAAHIPFQHHLTKQTDEQQSKKTRAQRLETAQLFSVNNPSLIKHKDILLIDDIYTTGTTLQHAKNALLEAGANTVTGFALIHS